MASSIIVLNQTPTQSPVASAANETTGQHTKLKINLNDVVVTAAAAVADSIQLSNGSLISPCGINKTGPLLNTIILSEELNNNLAKTFKETSLNKFSMSDSNLHKRTSSSDEIYDENNSNNKAKSQEIFISNLTISDDPNKDISLGSTETKHTRFKIRYHYNTYSNYQSYNEDRINSAGSNSSDSSTSSTSPVLSTDSNLPSPIINNLNTFPDSLSTPNQPVTTINNNNNNNNKLDDSHAFKISSILVSSKLKEDDSKSNDDDTTSSTVKVKMIANLKIQPNSKSLSTTTSATSTLPATPNDTSLKRQITNETNEATDLDEKYLAINGKNIPNETDIKSPLISPKLAAKSEANIGKKEKKRVSFNDSLLQVHLIPNVSYNSLSIEKFKYQLKTTTITMDNNGDFDEENEVINYENIPVIAPSSSVSQQQQQQQQQNKTEPIKQVNFSFYKPQPNNETNDQSKTSFVLSSSLISSYQQNETNNIMQTAQAAAANSKMYRTTIFKTFNNNNDSNENTKTIGSHEPTPMPRQMSANRTNINYRINSAHHRSRESNNTPQDNEVNTMSTTTYSKLNKKKDMQINYRIGSSSTSSSNSNNNNNNNITNNSSIYQNQRSYSSILASTFSSQPHLIANYSFSNQLQIKQQQQHQSQSSQQAQIQLQSNNLSIPFHASVNSPAVSLIQDESNSRSNNTNLNKTNMRSSPANQFISETKNENAILRVNSGTNKHVIKPTKNHNTDSINNNDKNEVHQSLAMSFELTPQLKFLSNLKPPKQSANIYVNNVELKDLMDEENSQNNNSNNKKNETQVQLQHSNRKLSTANVNSSNQETNLSAPIIANLSAGLFKQKFSTKPGSTKFIFLKSDDKQNDLNITPSSFSSSHFNSLNKSTSNSKIGFNNSNSIASSSAISSSQGNGSYSQFSDIVKLETNNASKQNVFNSSAKNLAMSTVNQLFALKDVNYYVANSTRALRKYHQQQTKANLAKTNQSINSGEITTIKLHSFSQNQMQNDRQTKSALPLLRSNIKLNTPTTSTPATVAATSSSTNIIQDVTKAATPTTLTESKNLSNCFNNLSYRLINTPTLIGNLHKAKTFLYNQTNNNNNSNFEKRIKENTNDKTSL